MTTNKYATLRGTIARAKRNDCQKVVMRVTLVEELLLQLSNAEKQVAALAAEVQAVRWAAGQVYSAGYNHGHLNTADELPYASDEELLQRGNEVLIEFTDPDHSGNVTDAVLDEVRAHDLNAFIRHHSAELDAHIKNGGEQFDEKSVRIRDIIVSARLFREQIRKEAAQ
ncbi:hypothetical protein [Enterobacter cloacae]|uniref:hypothetical protein n=1 Tax=Enterobacter cloacae TaxID=550 RepID=UPI002874A353|nr:hypothetical protein [Enterobacter cloacae]MDS0028108.1 hypothetical protein [Enterobacter cloacae subsp. cloacae]